MNKTGDSRSFYYLKC